MASEHWARQASRRFSTIEGWKDLGNGLYSATGQLRTIQITPEIGSEFYDFKSPTVTRPGLQSAFNAATINSDTRRVGNLEKDFQAISKSKEIYYSKGRPDIMRVSSEDSAIVTVPPTPEQAEKRQDVPEAPYHILSTKQKKKLVYIISLAGLFSPLSSNIYFPALDAIAKELKVSNALVSLTITSYLILQGISPSFWGAFADAIGRRPIYMGTFMVYIIANIGLALSPNFPALMVFRALQSAGSSATISIGAGVIGDISTPEERGGYVGIYGGIRMMGQSVGPVLGGVLANFLGFRSIFIFLLIFSTLVLAFIVFYLPETLRSIAGNGTIRVNGVYKPFIRKFQKEPSYMVNPDPNFKLPKVSLLLVLEPLKFLFEKDVFVSLIFGAVVYTVWSMVTSSTTALFKEHYKLNDLLTGLAFLPNGLGCVLGSYLTGRTMDNDYKKVEQRYIREHGLEEGKKLDKKSRGNDFPIEKARLRSIWWIVGLFIIAMLGYGWTLNTVIAVPLILQFFIAYAATAVFNINSALVIDLFPGKSASATAVNNLVRCSVGAAGVAVVDLMIASFGAGPTFTGLGLLTVSCVPLVAMEWIWGMQWRIERVERLSAKK
ncbi:hypothetical protein PRK78_000714 [Emydomyces testavorans]|uniref:Citrate exporter 1 n=1 Tax=Emydomyces testavorans TaxID=2070801 RepID=A0AAF0IEQ5_9EURO|nr:hypothetical protein PRK78_000714 [Emydomyces testavorans]